MGFIRSPWILASSVYDMTSSQLDGGDSLTLPGSMDTINAVADGDRRSIAEPGVVTVVSGLPRSGTSMMMRMLEVAGLDPFCDGARQPDVDNPNGYYELERVKALIRGDKEWVDEARGRVVKVVSPLLRYLPDDQEYRVILMRRSMDEVLASQQQMLVHRGEPDRVTNDARLAEVFEQDLGQVERWAETQPNVCCLQVDYNRLLQNPAGELRRIVEFLGAGLDVEAMAGVVDPGLYRVRR